MWGEVSEIAGLLISLTPAKIEEIFMPTLKELLASNKEWAAGVRESDPEFFGRLAKVQSPEYLWIGCSDSRITPNESLGLLPGELFVHRNIANLVIYSDMNCLSVMQFAVDVLKTPHIIVCGHYGCGGVRAAMEGATMGMNYGLRRLAARTPEDAYPTAFGAVPSGDLARMAWRLALSQLPGHRPAHQPLPAFADEWLAGYESGRDVTRWFASTAAG